MKARFLRYVGHASVVGKSVAASRTASGIQLETIGGSLVPGYRVAHATREQFEALCEQWSRGCASSHDAAITARALAFLEYE